jgi:hypothetical protein
VVNKTTRAFLRIVKGIADLNAPADAAYQELSFWACMVGEAMKFDERRGPTGKTLETLRLLRDIEMKIRSQKNRRKAETITACFGPSEQPAGQITADMAHAIHLTCLKMSELANTLIVLEKAIDAALAAAEASALDTESKPVVH